MEDGLERNDFVVLNHKIRQHDGVHKLCVFADQILVGQPAGSGSPPSDVH